MALTPKFPRPSTAQLQALNVDLRMPKELMDRLRDFGTRKMRNSARAAVGQAATIIKNSAQPQVPVYSGILKRSLGKKDSKHTSKGIYSLVGARRRFVGPKLSRYRIKAIKKKARKAGVEPDFGAKTALSKPSRYLHLVENGWTSRSGRKVPGVFMLRDAKRSARGAVLTKIRTVLGQKLRDTSNSDEIPTT